MPRYRADRLAGADPRFSRTTIYTDNRDRLASAIEGRDGAKVGAIDETSMRKSAAIAIPAPVRTPRVAIEN